MPRFETYTMRIEKDDSASEWDDQDKDALSAALTQAEHWVDNALPEGFYAKIDGPLSAYERLNPGEVL